MTDPRPIEDLHSTGLLWAINRVLLHPRGYALALVYKADRTLVGWELLGAGDEPWQYLDDIEETDLMDAFEALLAAQRDNPRNQAPFDTFDGVVDGVVER